jgi:hypothetical protein
MARCSICGTVVKPDDGVTSCPECTQDYHAACWTEIGGCATYGCTAAAEAEKPPPPVVAGAGWGDEKACPECGASIPSSRLVCRCGARFPWADPMTAEEYAAWRAREAAVSSTKKVIIALFVLSLIGVLAPLAGFTAVVYARGKRRHLVGGDGTYLAMAYGSAAIGAVYMVILALLGLGL